MESPETPPRVEPDVPSHRQALLDAAVTAAEVLGPECFPPPPSEAPMPKGFQAYGLPTQTSVSRPTLAWNPGQALSLAALDGTFAATNKFASATGSERSAFASRGQLLTPWSEQVPAALEPFVGPGSLLISAYWRKTEPLVCAAIEAQEHTIQLLEALGTILPAGSTDPKVSALLTGLSCTAFPTREALYKQLGNLRLLHRESMLRSASNKDIPTQDILRRAPLVSSTEIQFSPAVEDQVSSLTQTRSHQNTVSALCTLVSAKAPRPPQRPSGQSSGSGRGGARAQNARGRKAPSKPSLSEKARAKSSDFRPSRGRGKRS